MKDNNQPYRNVRVLLIEGRARQVMPLMESLHKLGCHVTTYNASKLDMGYASHYPDRKVLSFCDSKDPEKSWDAISAELKTKQYDLVTGTGHISAHEGMILVREGLRRGVRMVVTHSELPSNLYSNEQLAEAVRLGAVIEHSYITPFTNRVTMEALAEMMYEIDSANRLAARAAAGDREALREYVETDPALSGLDRLYCLEVVEALKALHGDLLGESEES